MAEAVIRNAERTVDYRLLPTSQRLLNGKRELMIHCLELDVHTESMAKAVITNGERTVGRKSDDFPAIGRFYQHTSELLLNGKLKPLGILYLLPNCIINIVVTRLSINNHCFTGQKIQNSNNQLVRFDLHFD